MSNVTKLYHYTSIDTLCSILKSYNKEDGTIELRATHIDFLNDATEGKILDKLKELIPDDISDENEGVVKLNDDEDIFITSFSKQKDDLNMWRSYAGTKGVCITFNSGSLDRYCSNFLEDQYLGLVDCKYPNVSSINIKGVISDHSLKITHNNNDQVMYLPCYNRSIQAKYKHYGFEAENETRIILSHKTRDVDFFVKKDIIKPFISYRVDIGSITEIWLATENNSTLTMKALKLMFGRYGITANIVIKKSDHPYVSL